MGFIITAAEGGASNPAGDEEPALTAARQGFSLAYKNKTLLSTVDPVSQGEKAAASVEQQDRTLYFCPSPLLGYGLKTFLSSLKAGSALICVETDEKLLALSKSFLETELLGHPRFVLSGESGGQKLCALVRDTWGSRSFRRVAGVKFNGGWRLDGETYGKLEEALGKNIALEWGNALTLVKLGRRYARNTIRNLASLAAPGSLEDFSFTGPALVLGAGPSLDGFLDHLAPRLKKQAERPFGLLCVDTCIPVLAERGIRPDLAVILESQHWNAADFIGARNSGLASAVDLSAYPLTTELLGGPRLFFLTPWTELRLLRRIRECFAPPLFPPLGSVGLSAVELACRLTDGPVIVSGMDFSFLPEKTHARGSPAHSSCLYSHNRLHSLVSGAAFGEGVFAAVSKSGVPVRTNPALRNYRALFEAEFSGKNALYDLAGTGLPLGLRTLSPEEALEMLFEGGGKARLKRHAPPEAKTASDKVKAFIDAEIAALRELRNVLTGSEDGGALPEGGAAGGSPQRGEAAYPLALQAKDTKRGGRLPPRETISERLSALLDELDYLWAHFPDCAEKGRPPLSDTGFLKRVRTEIDPFIKLWVQTRYI